ncbi:GTPase HflX [Haliangium ochraceum]|uniref:GTPase HflX n=1 Tax=Haliangium ochraceum TaxID=80816 RepID=UPI001E4F52D3|nr:GTPase HflX [Haliangium ochraceum]
MAATAGLSEQMMSASLGEMRQLLRGLGIEVVAEVVQRRAAGNAPGYLGPGKLRELARFTGGSGELRRGPPRPKRAAEPGEDGEDGGDALRADGAPAAGDDFDHVSGDQADLAADAAEAGESLEPVDLVVVDDALDPGQQRNLERATGAEVLDRGAVILWVFETRAKTRAAQLEIELARLSYELPRLRDDAMVSERSGGGGGRAARGHSNVVLAKQRTRDRIASLKRELAAVQASAATRRQRRASSHRVALLGYTNAGKSTLMRALTGSEVLVADALFASLDITVRQLAPPATPPVLVADTVGFMNRLPHELMASFRSTLDEVHEASLLLHVVDASDPHLRDQIDVVTEVVSDIGATELPTWLVLNKIDQVDEETRAALREAFPEAIELSALRPEDSAALRARIVDFFDQRLVTEEVEIPYAASGVLAELRSHARVLSEQYGDALVATVRASPEVLARLRKRLAEARA